MDFKKLFAGMNSAKRQEAKEAIQEIEGSEAEGTEPTADSAQVEKTATEPTVTPVADERSAALEAELRALRAQNAELARQAEAREAAEASIREGRIKAAADSFADSAVKSGKVLPKDRDLVAELHTRLSTLCFHAEAIGEDAEGHFTIDVSVLPDANLEGEGESRLNLTQAFEALVSGGQPSEWTKEHAKNSNKVVANRATTQLRDNTGGNTAVVPQEVIDAMVDVAVGKKEIKPAQP